MDKFIEEIKNLSRNIKVSSEKGVSEQLNNKALNILFSKKQIAFSLFSKGIKKRTRAIYAPFLGNFFSSSKTFSKKYRGSIATVTDSAATLAMARFSVQRRSSRNSFIGGFTV